MAFDLRITAYEGMQQIPNIHPKQFASDSVHVMIEPYKWSQKITSNGATPVSSAPDTTANVNVIRVEVADSQAIRYEIQPNAGTVRAPGTTSPKLTGYDIFYFKPGWTFSFVDAASV